MRHASSPETPPGHRLLRIAAVVVLSLAMMVAWTLMMNSAGETLSFEPTQESVVARAAARPVGVAWALLEVAAVLALATVARRMWLMWLAAPGLVVATTLVFFAGSNGGALALGLTTSVIGVGGASTAVVMRAYAQARRAHGLGRTSASKQAWPGLPG